VLNTTITPSIYAATFTGVAHLRCTAGKPPLPGESKDGTGAVRIHLQRAAEVHVYGRWCATFRKHLTTQNLQRRCLNRRWLQLQACGRRPDVDDTPGDKALAIRIADTVYQGIDLLALVMRNLPFKLRQRINASRQQRRYSSRHHSHVGVPLAIIRAPYFTEIRGRSSSQIMTERSRRSRTAAWRASIRL
jgi:hypothetical protein